jgi:general secretion pathway protein E
LLFDESAVDRSEALQKRLAVGLDADRRIIGIGVKGHSEIALMGLFSAAPNISQFVLADAQEFDTWIRNSKTDLSRASSLAEKDSLDTLRVDSTEKFEGSDSPAVFTLNWLFVEAVRLRATDIHLEQGPTQLHVRFRVDGYLTNPTLLLEEHTSAQLISRLKVLAGLDITEQQKPQDGRLTINIQARNIDVRVSILPSTNREHCVIRLLDKETVSRGQSRLSLASLGLDQPSIELLKQQCLLPHGMVLLTGPTGSGKTTTLYAALEETQRADEQIITIEDPIEYQLAGSLQIAVNEAKGISFASGLRSILRHDPDRILVGEIRDAETASIAVQASMTGHLVYTTLHANSAIDVVSRLAHLGISRVNLAAGLNAVMSQRLVRLKCTQCAKPSKDCEYCMGSGFSGRTAIAELLIFDSESKRMIQQDTALERIREVSLEKYGTRTLTQQAMLLVEAGRTTIDEVRRVIAVD